MKKLIVFYIFILSSLSFSISFLSEMSFDSLFDHKTWKARKATMQQELKERKFPTYLFRGQTIIGLDFSNLDLSGKDLTDCKFFKVNLQGTDLTNADIHNTHFDGRCNLVGAFFRYSLNGLERIFKVESNDPYTLVKQYSNLMDKKEKKEKAGFTEKAADLGKQTECLNYLFGALRLYLGQKNLKDFNLIDINFQNASLWDAQLQDARLSKDFTVPPYTKPSDLFNQFKEAVNANTPEKQYYLKLIHNDFNIFGNFGSVFHEHLEQVHWENLNLKNANLSHANLQKFNLNGVNLKGTSLSHADLTNTKLINTEFINSSLCGARLQGARFSEDFKLDYKKASELFQKWYDANKNDIPNKAYYNLLVWNKFNLFSGIDKERLSSALQEKLNVRNANLSFVKLEDVKLSGVNLENTDIESSCFNQSELVNINFKESNFHNTKFRQATFKKVNFNLSDLKDTDFSNAILRSVSFKGADLLSADFTGATLEDVDFFAANIRWMILAKDVRIPYKDDDNEQDYINFYHNCTHSKAKALLKIILESRDATLKLES